ncbi:MAG: hypothetical protein EPN21_08540 [Methylococcaceae bacterium]|nr:MAG: hypothetical protein EPN21_08540 [Methylococcaceae bacterium]
MSAFNLSLSYLDNENDSATFYESVNYGNEIDFVTVALAAGNTYKFELNGVGSGAGTLWDPALALSDYGVNFAAYDDNSGSGYDSLFFYTAPGTADYTLWAASSSSLGTGTYTLAVTLGDLAAGSATLGQISVGNSVSGNAVIIAGDHDWFRVSLTAGTQYRFELAGNDTSDGTLGDPELSLRNAAGTLLVTDDDAGTDHNALIEYAATSSGTYYLDAYEHGDNATGSYTLSAALGNHPPSGAVTIDGLAAQGQTLSVSHNLSDADGLGAISYQWMAGNTPIGAGTRYTLTAAEVGKAIHVIAAYTDGQGTAESVASLATAAVTPALSPGFAITALDTNTGEDGSSASYQIALNTAPSPNQNVDLTFTSSDTSEGVIAQPTLTFTSSNYAVPQTLTVRGVDDYDDDGSMPYFVSAKIDTIDVYYKALTISPFILTNTDDGLDQALDLYGDVGGSKIDSLVGGNGADTLHGKDMADNLFGGFGNDTLYGGYGADNLFGEAGDDKLQGEQENDYMDGGAGNDTLDGGDGTDTMLGGAGNDVYYLGYDAADVITDQGLTGDVDTVIMPYLMAKYTLPNSIENGTIAEGTQNSRLTGNSGNNRLTGNGGGNGLNGEVGRDALFGGQGRDVLFGGADSDTLTGGAGADRFGFNAPLDSGLNAARDVISDFKPGEGDKIDLSGIDANTGQAGNQTFRLIAAGVFSGAGQLRYDAATHLLYGSNDGDSAAEFAIQLNGVAGLSAAGLLL